jgi:signal peptidase II
MLKQGGMTRWLTLAALVILLDQLSKIWITDHFVYGETMTVNGVFDLVRAHNTGAAFNFLHDAGGMQRWLFGAIAVIASIWIVSMLRKCSGQLLFALALSLIWAAHWAI